MTNNNFKNNKTKTVTAIMTSLVIGLMMLSPMTILPNVNAQTQQPHYGLPPIKLSTEASQQIMKTQQYVSEQIHLHPGWVSLFSGDLNGITIKYLGPADKNPYYIANLHEISTKSGDQLVLSPSNNPQAQAGPASYGSSSYTTAYEIQQTFNNIDSTNSNVDFMQVLNAFNVGTTHWMQNGFTDDVDDLTGNGAGYYAVYDSYTIGGGHDAGFPVYDSLSVSSSTDDIAENDYANDDGTYTMYTTDTANSNYQGLQVGYSDTGAYMNLGYTTDSSNYTYVSGSMSEEESGTGSTWSWGTQTYYLAYWDCSGCSEITTVNNPWTISAPNSVTVSETDSPNAYDSMSY